MNEFFSTGLGKTLLIVGIVFLAVVSVGQLLSLRYIGAGITASNTITVNGEGTIYAVPDIAEFSFSVVSDKATVADAQADATAKANALTQYLTSQGINSNDMQTTDYSIEPQYEYQSVVCPTSTGGSPVYCPPGNQVLKGYEVRQTTTVKVRDTSKAGDLLAGVGSKGATEVSGLSFTFDDPNKVQDEARTQAITDAKNKANELAQELGVSIVGVTSFSENSSGVPHPMAFNAAAGVASAAPTSPDISTGQNKVTSDVTITYEIR